MTDYPPPPEQPQEPQRAQQPPQPPQPQQPPYGNAPPPPSAPPQPAQPLNDADSRMWAMLAHLANLLFSIVGPLIIWLIFRDRSPYVNRQAKEALNFGITVAIVMVGGWIAVSILAVVTGGIGALLAPLLLLAALGALVLTIMAAVAANKGAEYRYPINIRLVK